ncbi:MASE3 domain-containing protein, partial [Leptospira sp. SA-E8]|uniref:MASE3 domain-containing protein n=1 Tax=Leptospira sp. SA-E8 TaxID=3422259 RepID=UPI003EC011D2
MAASAFQAHAHPVQLGAGLGLLLASIPLFWLTNAPAAFLPAASLAAWLPYWQDIADMAAVVLAMLIFTTGYHAILSPRKGAVVLLGGAFLGISLLDFVYLLGRTALPEDPGPAAWSATLWLNLMGRLIAAAALLVYVTLPASGGVSARRKRLAIVLVIAAVLGLASIVRLDAEMLPLLLDPAGQATALLHGLQYSIVTLHLATLYTLWMRRELLRSECLMALAFAAALSVVSGVFYALSGHQGSSQ